VIRIVETEAVSSTGRLDKMPEPTLPEVAFAGRSNVGKSSLLNALAGRKNLFKVSKSPGRTRTVVHVKARLDTDAELYLVDLPGFGFAEVSKQMSDAWIPLIETYLANRPTLHLVVVLVDIRRGPEEDEIALFDYLAAHGVPAILVATKMDRLPKSKQKPVLEQLKKDTGVAVIGTSAETHAGLDRLLEVIVRALGFAPITAPPV
jgi:GTP-binding protein